MSRDDPVVDRIPASLIKLESGRAERLVSKDGKRYTEVDGFDSELLTVTPLDATGLRLTGKKAGSTEMIITYDNGDKEHVVCFVLARPKSEPQ